MGNWRERRSTSTPTITQIPVEKDESSDMDFDVNLHHLHRYFAGPWVKGKLTPVLGNEEMRIGATLNWLLCGNGTLIRGESGSDKTGIMNAIVALVYGDEGIDNTHEQLLVLGSSSDKALFTDAGVVRVDQAQRCYIPELQNVMNLEALLKLWLEGRNADDLRALAGGNKQGNYHLKPLPILTSLADANEIMPELSNEMKRRFLSFYTRSDQKLNEDVHRMKARNRMAPDEDLVTIASADFEGLRANFQSGMLDARRIIIPGAESTVSKVVPTKYTISNTFIDYWFDMVQGVTRFYRRERCHTNRYIFATPGDVYVAHLLVADVVRDLAIGIPPLGREIFDFIPKGDVWGELEADSRQNRKMRCHVDEVVDYLDQQGFPRSKVVIASAMERLVASGFVKQDERKLYYRTKDMEAGAGGVDWALLIEESNRVVKEKFPAVKGEYEEMSHKFLHPFTGETKDLVAKEAPPTKAERKGGLSNV